MGSKYKKSEVLIIENLGLRVGDTGIEPVTSSVSGKRAPAAPIARADDGTRTRDPHLGKVMLYQLSHIRVAFPFPGAQRKLADFLAQHQTDYDKLTMTSLTLL